VENCPQITVARLLPYSHPESWTFGSIEGVIPSRGRGLSAPRRYSPRPTRETLMDTIKRILVPTDFSAHADEAFRVAHLLARATGAEVIVFHVARPPTVAT